jgi:O-antigen/teichoic acid export membrane protein
MLIALICFFFISRDVRLAALAIFLAPLSALVFILLTGFKHRKRFSGAASQGPGLKQLLGFIIPTSFINFSSGFLTQLGPPLIRFFSTFALAGVFTASLDIFKAARTALTALFISIFPHLSRQEALKNTEKLTRMIRNGLILVGVAFIMLVAVAATYGQAIVRFVYGAQFEIEKVHLVMMALFTGFFLFSELFNRILLAKSMIKELIFSWGIAVMVMITLLLVPVTPFLKVEIAFLGAGSAAFLGMVLSFFRRTGRNETRT